MRRNLINRILLLLLTLTVLAPATAGCRNEEPTNALAVSHPDGSSPPNLHAHSAGTAQAAQHQRAPLNKNE